MKFMKNLESKSAVVISASARFLIQYQKQYETRKSYSILNFIIILIEVIT